jgi:histidine ammonia-lyase
MTIKYRRRAWLRADEDSVAKSALRSAPTTRACTSQMRLRLGGEPMARGAPAIRLNQLAAGGSGADPAWIGAVAAALNAAQ